ncbi:hypothetical protein [Pseudofrankia asymbiotica]|uniref:Uncharacterized protein n=1 Tax=Pseudofrankia asymbiotica TaxID=1834516 RepID=A0A1V2I192_9ACTN|nr:hypothetical protein [Pseudofrankia asymbiotica]ONH23293.1 hypothetical protein BL253_33230 [Pseudofrankia asymbiotica]
MTLVAGGTVLAIGLADGGDETARPSAERAVSETSQPAPGWRFESFLDIEVQVPASWGYARAPGTDWCASTGQPAAFPEQPYVDTGGGDAVVLDIACSPGGESGPDLHGGGVPREHWAPHVWFAATPAPNGVEELPDGRVGANGWTRIVRTVGSAKVLVLADDAHLDEAGRIVESARQTTVDHDGCDVSSPIQAGRFASPPAPFDVAHLGVVDTVAICQYDLNRPLGSPGLLASRQLGGADATTLLAAVRAAPVGGGPNAPDTCVKDRWGDTGIVLRLVAAGTRNPSSFLRQCCSKTSYSSVPGLVAPRPVAG